MTRKRKLAVAGALAGLLGTVAIIGVVQADNPRGYGPGYGPGQGRMMMDERGPGPQGMRGDERGPRFGMMGGWGPHHGMMGGRRGSGPHGFGMHGDMMRHLFELADADKDGKLTQEEIDQALADRFARYDADKDGKLSIEEFDNLFREITRPMMVRAFQRLDPDGDGGISADELGRFTRDLVRRLDRTGDGVLTLEGRRDRSGWHRWRGERDDNRGDDKN